MRISQLSLLRNILPNMAPSYYAVAKGRKPGIYSTWDQCKAQVHQYAGPIFKKFSSQAEAERFIEQNAGLKEKSKSTAPTLRKRLKPHGGSYQDSIKPVIKKLKLIDLPSSGPAENQGKEASTDYIINEDGYTNVYTDGACSANGQNGSRAGIGVWFGDGHPLNVSRPVVGRATNNMAEIQAVTVAAQQAKKAGISKLKINTDSKFLIKCIQEWMPKWKSNGWKTYDKKPVINKTELLEMEEALASLNVIWNHVNGHVGIYGNEEADKLARAGCSEYHTPV